MYLTAAFSMPAICKLISQDSAFELFFCCISVYIFTTAMHFCPVPLLPRRQEIRLLLTGFSCTSEGEEHPLSPWSGKTPCIGHKNVIKGGKICLSAQTGEEYRRWFLCRFFHNLLLKGFTTTGASDFTFQLSIG